MSAVFAGTKVTRLLAEDMDAPGSPNSHIVYQLLSPEPEEGTERSAFKLDSTSGSVTLGASPLHAGQNILLQVLAVDLGGAEGGKCPVGDPDDDSGFLSPLFLYWPPQHALPYLRLQQHM